MTDKTNESESLFFSVLKNAGLKGINRQKKVDGNENGNFSLSAFILYANCSPSFIVKALKLFTPCLFLHFYIWFIFLLAFFMTRKKGPENLSGWWELFGSPIRVGLPNWFLMWWVTFFFPGETVLMVAVRHGKKDVVPDLLRRMNMDAIMLENKQGFYR